MKRLWLLGVLPIALAIAWLWPREEAPKPKADVAKPAPAKQPRVDPEMLPPATIEGSVRDDSGAALVAEVCLVYERDQRCVKSGADGRFAIAGVTPDELVVVGTLPRYQPHVVRVVMRPGAKRVIDLVLKAGGVELAGTVEDILGGPIAGARVSVVGAVLGGFATETDERGRFTLWLPAWDRRSDPTRLRATASGYGANTETVIKDEPIVIALAPASTIAGRVVDETGAPVASARVSGGGARAISGNDGAFTLDDLALGDVVIEASTASKFGRAEGAVSVGIGDRVDNVVVRVHPAHAVIATVDVTGDRDLCDPTPVLRDWAFEAVRPWRAADGRFHFDGVPPGTYAVELGCGAQIAPVVVERDLEVTWRIDSGGIVKGRVLVQRLRPAFASVELAANGSRRPPWVRNLDANGAFEFRAIPPGSYTLRASFDREGTSSDPVMVDVVNGQTVERELAVRAVPIGRIGGRVVDGKGRATAGVTVYFAMRTATGETLYEATVRDGRYETEVPAGEYRVVAYDRERASQNRPATIRENATTTHDITLVRPITAHPNDLDVKPTEFVGYVRDASGAVADAVVLARTGREVLRATTGTDGFFTLMAKTSVLHVDVHRIGGGRTSATLSPDAPTTIVLGTTRHTIAGTVTRNDGTPARRFSVRDVTAQRTVDFEHTGGRFTLHVEKLPVKLEAVANGVASGEQVILDAAKSDVVLRLPPLVTVRGRIVDGASQEPVAGVRIHARRAIDGWGSWFIHADQVSGADGRFVVRDVPAASLLIELHPPLETWSMQSMKIEAGEKPDLGDITLARVRKR